MRAVRFRHAAPKAERPFASGTRLDATRFESSHSMVRLLTVHGATLQLQTTGAPSTAEAVPLPQTPQAAGGGLKTRGEGKARGSILPAGQFDSAAPHQRTGMIRRKARLCLPARHRTPRRCLKRRETPSGGRLRADTGNRRRLSPRPHHRPLRQTPRASVSLRAGRGDLLSQGSGAEDLPGCGTFRCLYPPQPGTGLETRYSACRNLSGFPTGPGPRVITLRR